MKLEEIKKSIKPGDLAFYSVRCCWWTTNPEDLGEVPDVGLPCCPYCGSVLMQAPAEKFIQSAEGNPSHYGDRGLLAFVQAHHSSGLHSRSWDTFRHDAILFARKDRKLSEVKSIRCVRCNSEFSEAEIGKRRSCPGCGATGVPMSIADDVTVRVNWHELRILGIFASNWAREACKGDDNDTQGAVSAILNRIRAQYPERAPLTLFDEIKEVQEVYPEMELVDESGTVVVPKAVKPS